MTASASLRRLRDLLDDGFAVTDVSSTDEHVILRLQQGTRRVTLQLGPDEARHLLGRPERPPARRVPA